MEKSINNTNIVSQNDADREFLTKIIAKALIEEDFRNIIKDEAMLMFDGDYDILYSKVGTKKGTKGNSIEDYLFDTYNQMKGKAASQSEFEKLVSFIPDFQISVPVNCEEWNTKNYTPLVTYIPENFDEKTVIHARAFDSNGKLHILSLEKDPEMPVVVIGSCERLELDNIYNKIDNSTKAPAVKITELKFDDLKDYEKWWQGKPEIYGKIYRTGNENPLGSFYSTPKRKKVNGKWKTYDHRFCYWYDSYGDDLYIKFWESDKEVTTTVGFTISVAFKLTTAITITPSVPIKVTWKSSKYDDMGSYVINKNDPSGATYSDSNFRFKLTH